MILLYIYSLSLFLQQITFGNFTKELHVQTIKRFSYHKEEEVELYSVSAEFGSYMHYLTCTTKQAGMTGMH